MTFKVRLTRDAEADLDRLFDFTTLRTSPFTCRKVGQSPFLRELVVQFGRSGYVALFEIEDESHEAVPAVRHQFEDDHP